MKIEGKMGRPQRAGKCQGQLSSFKHPSYVNSTLRRKKNSAEDQGL